jgi:surfactin synthase thioesterase subunit
LADREVSREDLAAWREQTSGRFFVRLYPGHHFFLHQQRAALLAAIGNDLVQSARQQPA